MSLSVPAKMCDRFHVSDRACASVASAVLKNNGIIDEQNNELIIDRSKIKREREREIHNIQSFRVVSTLYFDGKKR